jgi:hypothetical protein
MFREEQSSGRKVISRLFEGRRKTIAYFGGGLFLSWTYPLAQMCQEFNLIDPIIKQGESSSSCKRNPGTRCRANKPFSSWKANLAG